MGRNWDEKLPFVLFAYRTSVQESTKGSPFFLLYGRDPVLPTEEALSPPRERGNVDVSSYREALVTDLSEAWKLAQAQTKKAQRKQKANYDRTAKEPPLRVGDRVFLYVPSAKRGKAHKFARPFKGPYRVVHLYDNGADIRPVDRPRADTV